MIPAIDKFAEWFQSQEHRLRALPSSDIVDEVIEKLCGIDDRLGVEVERFSGCGRREIIITAFSDPDAFLIVRAIVELIGPLPNWNVCALKPRRGFGFSIVLNGQKLRADSLYFRQIADVNNGFELLAPEITVSGEGAEETAWLIVETGIGEELAGKIGHLEFGNSADLHGSNPITQLEECLRSK